MRIRSVIMSLGCGLHVDNGFPRAYLDQFSDFSVPKLGAAGNGLDLE